MRQRASLSQTLAVVAIGAGLTAALVVSACSSPLDLLLTGVELHVDATAYAAGDTVGMTLINGSDEDIDYSLCSGTVLEQRVSGVWGDAPSQPPANCVGGFTRLKKGQQATGELPLPGDLGEGDYRFRTRVQAVGPNTLQDIASNAFRVSP